MIPLILIVLLAWQAATVLSEDVTDRSAEMADGMLDTIQKVGDTVIHDSTEALDDFSTGYSTLSYLKKLALD